MWLDERLREDRERQVEKKEISEGEPEREFTERSMWERVEEQDEKLRIEPERFMEASFREVSSSRAKR